MDPPRRLPPGAILVRGPPEPGEVYHVIPVRNRLDWKVLTLDPGRYKYQEVYRQPSGTFRVKNAINQYAALAAFDPQAFVVPTKDLQSAEAL